MRSEALPAEYQRFPVHWKILLFSEAFEDKTGGQTKIQKGDYLNDGLLPIVDQGQRLFGGFTNDPDFVCEIELPCILFGDHTKTFKFIEKPFALGADGVKVLKQRSDIDPKFAFHYLNTLTLPDVGYSRHFRFLKRTFFPIPPLEEQRRIAAILDKADAVRRKRQQAIALTEELLRSAFLEMFGDPVTNPKGWEMVTVSDIVSDVRDGPHVSPEYSDDGIPILSTRNIRPARLVMEDVKYISEKTYSKLVKQFKPQHGDVLLTKGGTTGFAKAVDWNWSFAIWVHLAALRPTKRIRPEFLEAALNSPSCYKQSQLYTHGIANRDLGLSRIRKIQLFLPPLHLQEQYCNLRQRLLKQLTTQESSLRESDRLFNSLLQRAFRGEL